MERKAYDKRVVTDYPGNWLPPVSNNNIRFPVFICDNSLSSFDHPNWRSRMRMGHDVGGPFLSIKRESRFYRSDSFSYRPANLGSGDPWYVGSMIPAQEPPTPVDATLDLLAWVNTAYNRMKPTNPSIQGLNALYELKDLPRMLEIRVKDLRNIGRNHLEWNFGWMPLLRDIVSVIRAQETAQQRLQWLIRNAGKPINREIELLDDTTTSGPTLAGTAGGYTYPAFASANYTGYHRRYHSTLVHKKIWACGTYRFWLPPGPRSIDWDRDMLMRIYGMRVTPSVVYNAVPWSWLVDWFIGLGEWIKILEPGIADRLAAERLYIMGTSISSSRYDIEVGFKPTSTSTPTTIRCHVTKSVVRKQRIRGNPFGLTAAPQSLTAMQLSILGALGLSRLG